MDDQPIKDDPKGFYEILGLTKDSSQLEIRKAYKKAALLYHPDKNVDNRDEATQKFKQISEAYSILGDEEKRELYDRGNEDESLYFQEEAKCTCPNCGRPRDFDPFDFVEFFFGLKEHIQNLVNSDEYDSDEYEEDYSSEDSRYYNENMHKPDKPKKPQCIFVNGRVKVTWIENNTRADYFKLYMKTNKKNSVPVCINENELDSGENCYYIQGLNPGTYFFCVAGVNDAGEGEKSMWTDLVVPSQQKGNGSKDKKKKKVKKNKTVNFEKELKTAVEEEDFEKVYELYPSINRYPSLNKTLVNQVETIIKNRKKEKEIRDLVNKYKETLNSCIKSQSLLDLRKVINAIENNSKLEKYFIDDLPKAKEVLEKIELENLEKIKEKEFEKQKEKEEKEKYIKESQQKKREEKEIKKKRYQEEQQRLERERKLQEEKERKEKEKMNRKSNQNKNNSSNNKDNSHPKENNQPQKNPPKDIKKNKENKEINKDNNNNIQSKTKSKEEKRNGINNQQHNRQNGIHKQNGVQNSKAHKQSQTQQVDQSQPPQQHVDQQHDPNVKSNHVHPSQHVGNNGENFHQYVSPIQQQQQNLHVGPKIDIGSNLDNKDSLFGQQRVNLNNTFNHLLQQQQQLNNNMNGMHQNMNNNVHGGLPNGSSHNNPHLNSNFNLNITNLNSNLNSNLNNSMEPNSFNGHVGLDPNFNNLHNNNNNSFHNHNSSISPNSSSRPFLFNPNPPHNNNVHTNGIWSFNNEMHNPNVHNNIHNTHGNIHGNVHNNNVHNNMNIPNNNTGNSFFNPNLPSNTPNHSKLNSFLYEQQPNGSSDLPLQSPYFYNNPFSFSGFPSSNPLFFNPNSSFPVSNSSQSNFFPQQTSNNIPQQSFFQPSLSTNPPFYENNLFFNPNKPFDKNPSNL